jgi:dihydrofolate reductase
LVGSPSLIVQLAQLGLVDEYHLGVQPTVVGSGLPLFKNITDRIDLKLLKTKTFGYGAAFFYYEPAKKMSVEVDKRQRRSRPNFLR